MSRLPAAACTGETTGPTIARDWCFIRAGDTAAELWRLELAPMGLRLFREALVRIAAGQIDGRPQGESLAMWEPALIKRKLGG